MNIAGGWSSSGGGGQAGKRWSCARLGRHMATLTEEHSRLSNRLHAAEGSRTAPRCVREDLKRSMAGIKKRVASAAARGADHDRARGGDEAQAAAPGGQAGYRRTQRGADPGRAGGAGRTDDGAPVGGSQRLDPAHEISGTSVHKRSRISRQGNRHLRKALFMPALSAARFDPHMRAFYLELQNRHKTSCRR